jgi:uncharacterized protein (TIGR03435 family)
MTDATPQMSTALEEQLGLRLECPKRTAEMLVVDHVVMPSEN